MTDEQIIDLAKKYSPMLCAVLAKVSKESYDIGAADMRERAAVKAVVFVGRQQFFTCELGAAIRALEIK